MSSQSVSNVDLQENVSGKSGPGWMRELLARYDELIELEIAELVNIHRQLTPVEAALLESDDHARAPLTRFRREHRSETRTPINHYAGLLATLAVSFGAIVWALASIS